MQDDKRDFPYPGAGLLKDEDAHDLVKIQYRTHRTRNPDVQLALERAVEDHANSPEEAEEGMRLVASLEKTRNFVR